MNTDTVFMVVVPLMRHLKSNYVLCSSKNGSEISEHKKGDNAKSDQKLHIAKNIFFLFPNLNF